MCFEGTGTLPGSDLMREINLGPAPPYIRSGAPEGECSGERERRSEGAGVTAPYTHLRLSLDCYPIPYSSISHRILRNAGLDRGPSIRGSGLRTYPHIKDAYPQYVACYPHN